MGKFPSGGLYVHIPFCVSKCRYCNFYSLPNSEEFFDAYTDRVVSAIEYYAEKNGRSFNSVYFGGGTPLSFGEERLVKILNAARPYIDKGAEITAEGNPVCAGKLDFASLRDAGFNRLSFGLQSSDDRELKALGRIHTAKDAEDSVRAAQNAGFDNISLDLMLGIPYQDEISLRKSVHFCSELGIQHISAYMLKIEEGTPLARSQELCDLCADEEKLSDLYLCACEMLETKGFRQYEISNFTQTGFESRHNLGYWLDGEYLGIGPSAHSYIGTRRYYFENNLKDFLEKPFEELEKEESVGGGWEEYAMLRLRLNEGLNMDEFSLIYPDAPTSRILGNAAKFKGSGLVDVFGKTICLTQRGFLLSNAVTGELLYG